MKFLRLTMALALLCLAVTATKADTFNAFNDYSSTNNPNGVWAYGSSPNSSNVFTAFTNNTVDNPGFNYWSFANVGTFPFVGRDARFPGYLVLHPSAVSGFERSVVIFTAPLAGSYTFTGDFSALNPNGTGTTTDFRVVFRTGIGSDLLVSSGNISYYPQGGGVLNSPIAIGASMLAGQQMIFSVGPLGNQDFDQTGLQLTVTDNRPTAPIPEPASMILLGTGLAGIGGVIKRRRNKS